LRCEQSGRFTVLAGLPGSSDVTSCAGGHPVSLPDSWPRAITKSALVKGKRKKKKRKKKKEKERRRKGKKKEREKKRKKQKRKKKKKEEKRERKKERRRDNEGRKEGGMNRSAPRASRDPSRPMSSNVE